MCLIFDILDTSLESCSKVLLLPNKSKTAKLLDMFLILKTRRPVQIACQKARFNVIYLTLVIEPAIDLCFVLLKYTISLEIINTYL